MLSGATQNNECSRRTFSTEVIGDCEITSCQLDILAVLLKLAFVVEEWLYAFVPGARFHSGL